MIAANTPKGWEINEQGQFISHVTPQEPARYGVRAVMCGILVDTIRHFGKDLSRRSTRYNGDKDMWESFYLDPRTGNQCSIGRYLNMENYTPDIELEGALRAILKVGFAPEAFFLPVIDEIHPIFWGELQDLHDQPHFWNTRQGHGMRNVGKAAVEDLMSEHFFSRAQKIRVREAIQYTESR